jgi:hypothetical protein
VSGVSKREMLFVLGDLPLGETRRLSYVTIPDSRAEGREEVNSARAEALTPGGYPVTAGPAQAAVRVAGSLVPSESVIVGRVYVDDNHNGFFDEGEVGVPVARIYLEDGTFTLTDVVGKYHLEGVRPGLHVVKVDAATLPEGLMSFASWSSSAGGAGTQFAETGPANLLKTNVATGGWGIAVSRLRARAWYRTRERLAPRGNPRDEEDLEAVDQGESGPDERDELLVENQELLLADAGAPETREPESPGAGPLPPHLEYVKLAAIEVLPEGLLAFRDDRLLADLAGRERITAMGLAEALQYRAREAPRLPAR